MQSNDARHEPSLVQNGFFTQGLSHWFGSFLRHRFVRNTDGTASAKYYAQIFPERLSAYPEGVSPGLNQFLDLPELYTYPAQRVASVIRLQGLGDRRFLLDAMPINPITGVSETRLNGRPLAEGSPTALGKSKYFQHPFLYRDDTRTVAVESGARLQITPFSQNLTVQLPAGFRAGPLIQDRDVSSDQAFAGHILTAAADTDLDVQISSSRDFPSVVVRLGDPGSIQQSNMTFSGPGVNLLETFPRTDGRGEGIKKGDTISLADGRTVLAYTDGTTIDDGRYQLVYRNIRGAVGVPSGSALISDEWTVYPEMFVDVTYGMPLYQYDFTLAYSYRGGDSPGAAQIQFLGLGEGNTISSFGSVVETIVANPEERVELGLSDSFWTRRFEHIVDEFVEPVAARACLNIPPAPPTFSSVGRPLPADLVSIRSGADPGQPTNDQFVIDFTYTLGGVAPGPGVSISTIDAKYDLSDPEEPVQEPRKYEINTGGTGAQAQLGGPGSQIYLTGYLHTVGPQDFDAGPWVRQLLSLRGPFRVDSYRTVSGEDYVTIELTDSQDAQVAFNGFSLRSGDGSPLGPNDTILRLATSLDDQVPYIQPGDLVRVDGDFIGDGNGVSVFDPIFELDSLVVEDVIAEAAPVQFNAFDLALPLTVRVSRPDVIVETVGNDQLTDGSPSNPGPGGLRPLVAASQAVQVGNVSLLRGYRYHRLANTDTADTFSTILSEELSIDPLYKTALAEDTVVPKGAVVLYAGGGACPVGYTPLRGEAESNTLGLENVQRLSLPTIPNNIIYDEDTDITTLRYPGEEFNQLDDQGEPLPIPDTAAVFTVALDGITGPNDEPIYRQVRVQRFRQLVEPGMVLRVAATTYQDGSSPLVSATDNDITSVDAVGPTANSDRGHLVVNVQPILRNEGQSVSSTAQAIRFTNFPENYEAHRSIPGTQELKNRYGNGFGTVQYPALNPAYYDATGADPNAISRNPTLFPQGPQMTDQDLTFNDVFPSIAGSDAWPANKRVILVRPEIIKSDGVRLKCDYWGSYQGGSGYGGTINIPELGGNIVLNNTNNALNFLRYYRYDGQNQAVQGRDVLYARWYFYENGNFRLHDAFFAIVTASITSDGQSIPNIYRYDRRKFQNTGQGIYANNFGVGNSVLILHPAKFYGAPGVRQAMLRPPAGQPGQTTNARQPVGKADGLTQSKLSLQEDVVSWVTENPQAGTEIQIVGRLSVPEGQEGLLVGPSGYLRYGNETGLLDYGAGGHTHRIMPNTALSTNDPIPRLHRNYQGQYIPVRLPVEHGHGSFGTLRYPLPAAELFGLCIKL